MLRSILMHIFNFTVLFTIGILYSSDALRVLTSGFGAFTEGCSSLPIPIIFISGESRSSEPSARRREVWSGSEGPTVRTLMTKGRGLGPAAAYQGIMHSCDWSQQGYSQSLHTVLPTRIVQFPSFKKSLLRLLRMTSHSTLALIFLLPWSSLKKQWKAYGGI